MCYSANNICTVYKLQCKFFENVCQYDKENDSFLVLKHFNYLVMLHLLISKFLKNQLSGIVWNKRNILKFWLKYRNLWRYLGKQCKNFKNYILIYYLLEKI